jgi:hypothetical protein
MTRRHASLQADRTAAVWKLSLAPILSEQNLEMLPSSFTWKSGVRVLSKQYGWSIPFKPCCICVLRHMRIHRLSSLTHILILTAHIYLGQNMVLTLSLFICRLLHTLHHRQSSPTLPGLRPSDDKLRPSYYLLFCLLDRSAHAYNSYDNR